MLKKLLVIAVMALWSQDASARDVIMGANFGIRNVFDADRCDSPHIKAYALTDAYLLQISKGTLVYDTPFFKAIDMIHWSCRSPAYDYVLPVDYFVFGTKLAEIQLSISWENGWYVRDVIPVRGAVAPENAVTVFFTRVVLDALKNEVSTIPVKDFVDFASVEGDITGKGDVLAALAILKGEPPGNPIVFNSSWACSENKEVMRLAADAGSEFAAYRVANCLRPGTGIDAISNGHPALMEMEYDEYDVFRFYLAKSIYVGFNASEQYLGVLDDGTKSELMQIVKLFKENGPNLSFQEYQKIGNVERSFMKPSGPPRESELSPLGIVVGLIAFGIALEAIAPDQSGWTEDQRQSAYEAEQERLQTEINTDLALGWISAD